MNIHTGAVRANLQSHKKIHSKIPESFEMSLDDGSNSDLLELEFSK